MPENYYRSGQAAKQLGVSSYHVRRLCEAGEISAEITAGNQWRIPLAEIRRLQKEGVPPVPHEMEADEDEDQPELHHTSRERTRTDPAPEVAAAANAVRVTASRVEQRRLEREAEEVEDWFRERTRRETARENEERQRKEAERAQLQRQEWIAGWTRYALSAIPFGLPREAELDVHHVVTEVFERLDFTAHEATIKRLIGAATEKALAPWRRAQDRRKAIECGINRLPVEVKCFEEFATLKARAVEAATAAVARFGVDANRADIELAASEAVRPMVQEFEHQKACNRAVTQFYLPGATSEEMAQGKKLVRRALAELPLGASQKQIERATRNALIPLETKVARREQTQKAEQEERSARQEAGWKTDARLWHVEAYLREEYEFDGGPVALHREAERLKPIIRELLIEELIDDPETSYDDIDQRIEELVDDEL